MRGKSLLRGSGALAAVVLLIAGPAWGDLATEFNGFRTVWDVGVSGLRSSYSGPTSSGNLLPSTLAVLGPDRVTYPSGVGQVPSPGGYDWGVARNFDEGALGVRLVGGNLVVKLATALNPRGGYFDTAWNSWYGQGDMFLAVQDQTGLHHFALLSAWARDSGGTPRTLDDGYFASAQAFHTQGGSGGTNLEGHLVSLTNGSQVLAVGGGGAYSPAYSPPPDGLDYRAFAQGGTDLGSANLAFDTTQDFGLNHVSQPWYIETWSIPITLLTNDSSYQIGFHTAPSCGNDQIDGIYRAPLPGALVLGLIGLGTMILAARRMRKAHGATIPDTKPCPSPEC